MTLFSLPEEFLAMMLASLGALLLAIPTRNPGFVLLAVMGWVVFYLSYRLYARADDRDEVRKDARPFVGRRTVARKIRRATDRTDRFRAAGTADGIDRGNDRDRGKGVRSAAGSGNKHAAGTETAGTEKGRGTVGSHGRGVPDPDPQGSGTARPEGDRFPFRDGEDRDGRQGRRAGTDGKPGVAKRTAYADLVFEHPFSESMEAREERDLLSGDFVVPERGTVLETRVPAVRTSADRIYHPDLDTMAREYHATRPRLTEEQQQLLHRLAVMRQFAESNTGKRDRYARVVRDRPTEATEASDRSDDASDPRRIQ